MASRPVIALNTTTPQLLAPQTAAGDDYSMDTALNIVLGAVTTGIKPLNITVTWNAGGVTFPGAIFANVTNTASAAGSLLMDLQVGGVSKIKGDATGRLFAADGTNAAPTYAFQSDATMGMYVYAGGFLGLRASSGVSLFSGVTESLRVAGGVMSLGSTPISFGTAPGISDVGISRVSAGVAGIGNGSAADFSGSLKLTDLTINRAASILTTSVALTNGAGASAGTIANAPAVGNPTKWIGINDNGTVRYIPAW